MYLKTRSNGDLVEILDVDSLCNPLRATVEGLLHTGEERQASAQFAKKDLAFQSGEELPRCWCDVRYKH